MIQRQADKTAKHRRISLAWGVGHLVGLQVLSAFQRNVSPRLGPSLVGGVVATPTMPTLNKGRKRRGLRVVQDCTVGLPS